MELLKALVLIVALEGAPSDAYVHPVSQARGRYQIKPVVVEEVNRILKRPVFKHADASDPIKAQQMAVILLAVHVGLDARVEDYLRVWKEGRRGARLGRGNAYVEKGMKILRRQDMRQTAGV